jgi:hypothetical protein
VKSPPPKPEVILTNFFAEPTVLPACADYQPCHINKQNIDNSECFGVKYVKIYPEMTSQ